MAIRVRRGNQADFDGNKLVAGELGLVLDRGEVYFCYSPGNTKKLMTAEDLQNLLNASPEAYQALQQLLVDLTADPNELVNILNNISALQSGKLDKIGDSKDNVTTFTEATTDTDIASGEKHSTIFGKVLKSIKTIRSGKIDKTSIVNTDTINDTTKVPSTAVTHALGLEVDALTNNFANYLDLNMGTLIAENTDLATITNVGIYYCTSDSVAASLINCPTTKAFRMVVYKSNNSARIIQEITDYLGDTKYIRAISNITTSPSLGTTYKYVGVIV